jgi:hypothetical protein
VENQASSATTRQYAQQEPASPYDASYQSQLAQARLVPENRSGGQRPGPVHLYHDQIGQQIPNYPVNNYPANYQQAAPKKSGALKWILLALMCVVLVSGAISAMVISVIHSQPKAPVETGRARQIEPPQPQEPLPPPAVPGSRLEQYKYPNARVKNSFSLLGTESLILTTSDSVGKVGDYYKKRLGIPMAEDEGRAVIFNISGPPTIVITISQEENNSDQTVITVVKADRQPSK